MSLLKEETASSIQKAVTTIQEGKSKGYAMAYLKDAIKKLYPNLSDSKIYELALQWYHEALRQLDL